MMNLDAQQQILESSVADHLQTDFCRVRDGQSVGEAIVALRQQPPSGQFYYIYVLDHAGRLKGVLPTRVLIFSSPETPVAELMIRATVTIPSRATVLEACEFFIQHRYLAMPVVDSDGRLLGIVDVGLFADEVFDLADKRAHNDVFQLLGIHVINNQQIDPVQGFRDRFPWLIANMVGGTLCAVLSQRFEGLLAAVIAVAMFVPVVLTLSESVSIQSMSILLQGLHGSGGVNRKFLVRALTRELAVALLLGVASGTVVGSVAGLWLQSGKLGLALCISLTMTLVCAGILGVIMPIGIRLMRADPRIAAGPITLAMTDIVTLLVYFASSTRLLL
jgi:magnesium transporter